VRFACVSDESLVISHYILFYDPVMSRFYSHILSVRFYSNLRFLKKSSDFRRFHDFVKNLVDLSSEPPFLEQFKLLALSKHRLKLNENVFF